MRSRFLRRDRIEVCDRLGGVPGCAVVRLEGTTAVSVFLTSWKGASSGGTSVSAVCRVFSIVLVIAGAGGWWRCRNFGLFGVLAHRWLRRRRFADISWARRQGGGSDHVRG